MASEFTKFQAEALAKWDRNWIVKPVRGKPGTYMVWCPRSDHYVEFGERAVTDEEARRKCADRIDGYDRDDLGESQDY